MILFFMVLTLVSTVTVGWFGIVQNKNSQLASKNDSLVNAQAKVIAEYINFINSQNQKKVETIKSGDKKEIVEQVTTLQNNTDTLAKNLQSISPEKAAEVTKSGDTIQNILAEIKRTPSTDTGRIKMLSNKVILTNSRIRSISNEAVKFNKANFKVME
jgi:hypothetical protein